MKKRDKIIYWIATLWLALGMTSTGIVQLMQMDAEVEMMNKLGYPIYFLSIIGVWKILGVVAVLIPKRAVLKEWAYAGFFFTTTGAIVSHIAVDDPMADVFPPLLLLVLTIVSWYYRPISRKTTTQNK